MSKKSAGDRYDERRLALLETEKSLAQGNSRGLFETVILFPRPYEQAMAHLSFHRIHKQLSTWSDTVCSRAFYPDKDEYNWRRRSGTAPVTLDTGTSLDQCDLLLVLIPGESDYLPALEMMEMAGMTLRAAKRREKWPLVFATGLSVTANPMPLMPFFDAFLIGESEPILGPVLDTVKSMGRCAAAKEAILQQVAELPGMFVPRVHGLSPRFGIMRQWASTESVGALTGTISARSVIPETWIVEVARGCPYNCRFCMPGYLFLPYREQHLEEMEETIRSIPMNEKVIFTACTPSGHYQMDEIISFAGSLGLTCHASSHRREAPEMVEEIPSSYDVETLLFAPETGSDGLRKVLGKGIANRDYLEQLATADPRVKRIRINFQIGLPFETAEDREENVRFLQMILQNTKLPVSVRMDPFIPRPWTAFQWSPMLPPQKLRALTDHFIREAEKLGITEIVGFSPRDAHVYALLSRGDRKVAAALEARLTGVGWNTAFEKAGVDMNWVFQQIEVGSQFGWDFLNMGFGYTRLAREFQAAAALDEERR
jgi:radical SAM superfamily enzyme YgiQ (UPF0313 family)